MQLNLPNIALGTGTLLMLAGLYGILTNRNIIRMILGFSIFDTGLNILIVTLGYMPGRTAPIIDNTIVTPANITVTAIDPVPQALVLTAIVIGFGVTALMLVYALKLNQKYNSLDINDYTDLKW